MLLCLTSSTLPEAGCGTPQDTGIPSPEQEVNRDDAFTGKMENLPLHESALLSDRLDGHTEAALILYAWSDAPAILLVSQTISKTQRLRTLAK